MEELYHRCKTNAPMEFIFTTNTGQVVEVKAEDLPVTSPYSPNYDPHVMAPKTSHGELPAEVVHYLKSKKLQAGSLDAPNTDGSSDIKAPFPNDAKKDGTESPRQCSISLTNPPLMVVSRQSSSTSIGGTTSPAAPQTIPLTMVYNEYGELVSAHSVLHPGHSKDMSKLQILRIIKKGYHHNYRKKMGAVIAEQLDGKSSVVVDTGHSILGDRLSAWEFKPNSSPKSNKSGPITTPDETTSLAVYSGTPRILEIGCGDGIWCFEVKKKYPDRIIEGVDDTDHWSCIHKDLKLRDFMDSSSTKPMADYFSTVHATQENPEFTVRNINQLLKHPNPIPHNLYGLVRGRDIFDKIESYKTFLEDVRCILQPDGVVEFIELDPRPRYVKVGRPRADTKHDHTSGPKTDWTDNIVDRFKNKDDEQLANNVPGWMKRVTECLKATIRPRDGVPGPQLKSWLEGAGFYDVKQHVIQLPVGGGSKAGKLMKDFIFFKHTNEDEIPNLKTSLPIIETAAIESGDYYLNLHMVTGRKPQLPRAGDLLLDGSRQEMTASKYEAMARTNDSKTNQWKRLDLDVELTGLVHGFSVLSGAPAVISTTPAVMTPPNAKYPPFLSHDGVAEGKGKENKKSDIVEVLEEEVEE